MALSNDLLSLFAKNVTNNDSTNKETVAYGTIKYNDGVAYVQLDGSDRYTPISTTTDVEDGERVTVMIKNHTVIVTGNVSSPSARTDTVKEIGDKVSDFDTIIADHITVKELQTEVARIETLITTEIDSERAKIDELLAKKATIDQLNTERAEIDELLAKKATIEQLNAELAEIDALIAKYATIDQLNTERAEIDKLLAKKATIEQLNAELADIDEILSKKINTDSADIKYAQIDFSNIDKAWMEEFYARSGIVEYVTVDDQTVTGTLVGVTIKGDLIEGGTIVADKLVIKGTDGLYYKLNTAGLTDEEGNTITEAEQTDYNSLNGTVIQAKSITASKINVSDLVAFDATIGGFTITDSTIYSEVKDSSDNVTRGIYMDSDGQINFGDESNFIKYYRDDDGSYKLAISAASILYALDNKQYSISDLGRIGDYVHISTYEDEPCIELGEEDSDFRLIITNTRILFMEGSTVPAYINNQSLHITKAVIEEEIQQGEFVWKVRQNGNMGLMWKGEA